MGVRGYVSLDVEGKGSYEIWGFVGLGFMGHEVWSIM